MRRKTIIYCEACGAKRPNGEEFVVFHCLAFCSADCREEYRAADALRRNGKPQEAGKRRKAA